MTRQMTTHLIDRSADASVTCFVRTEDGRPDLSAATVDAVIRAYGKQFPIATLTATGDANGKVDFIVPASLFAGVGMGYDYGLSCDPRNLASFDVLADGALVYRALMEIV